MLEWIFNSIAKNKYSTVKKKAQDREEERSGVAGIWNLSQDRASEEEDNLIH